ncbi:MAG TPA: sugar ABC transporter ATP-binding protein [Acetobacteraceae bacterium]|nr:sugar ABC transporter ATP-binding protein [Acetobacteraceae bacterium]
MHPTPCHGPGLSVRHLQKSFGGVRALSDGSVEARRGEVHGILGENGAGKSTLIRVLSGVISRDDGEVILDGQSLRLGSPAEALRANIRTVFQESSLIPALTVAENMLFDRLPIGWHWRLRTRALRFQYARLMDGLGARWLDPSARVAALSVADRQLLEVAKAIAASPNVLILDEATSALSLADAEWVLHQARRIADGGGVVLFVSHRLQEVKAIADRVTVLRSGRTVFEAKADETVSEDDLIEAMLGRRLARLYPQRESKTQSGTLLQVDRLRVGTRLGPVDFMLGAGEILGVTALPGQGQRELLMSLSGDLRYEGAVALAGRRYAPRSPAEAQKYGVFMVPEDRQTEALFLHHSVQFNVTCSVLTALTRGFSVLDPRREQETARSGANRVGLDPQRLPNQVATLSGGNQQKTIFARALLGKPKVFILFDSTRGVDVGTKADIYRLVAHLADEGMGVIFYSTDFTETLHVCDRILVLHAGRIAGTAPAKAWDEEKLLRCASGQTAAGAGTHSLAQDAAS